MARLDDAISHLACALGQVVPSDDAILVGHMRDALALLRTEHAIRRMRDKERHACTDCGDPLPTGDAEPCSGLCESCDAAEAEKRAYLDALEERRWSRRERDEERYERERDGIDAAEAAWREQMIAEQGRE